ncbi:MAG: DUF3617 domain-containing protein [Xanthomonadales bacterium]|nr:DUF3617 domain-containing protein [Xanthomonadales bacterium]
MKFFALLCGLTAMIFVVSANAQGVSITPGKWEMTSTMTMSMLPTPQTFTATECVKESELSPDHFNMDEENPCNFSNVEMGGDTARWSIECPSEGGPAMKGQWEFTSHGDTLSGNGSMTANYGGQEMGFTMTWEGKRIGDCEE